MSSNWYFSLSLSNSKSPRVSWPLSNIQADLKSVVVLMVLFLPPISNYHSLLFFVSFYTSAC